MRLEEFVKNKEVAGKIKGISHVFGVDVSYMTVSVSTFFGANSDEWHANSVKFPYRGVHIDYFPLTNKAMLYEKEFSGKSMRDIKKSVDDSIDADEAKAAKVAAYVKKMFPEEVPF